MSIDKAAEQALEHLEDVSNIVYGMTPSPHEVHFVVQHRQKLTVWCEFLTGGISGSYFIENNVGETIIVNGTTELC